VWKGCPLHILGRVLESRKVLCPSLACFFLNFAYNNVYFSVVLNGNRRLHVTFCIIIIEIKYTYFQEQCRVDGSIIACNYGDRKVPQEVFFK